MRISKLRIQNFRGIRDLELMPNGENQLIWGPNGSGKSVVRNIEGLTKTYNRFHDLDETSTDILKLRELHAAMDRAVVDAYGWTDLHPTCEFFLDSEDDEPDDDEAPTRTRKKPWRYRWPDDLRDEVLARLLELNQHRAEAERVAGESVNAGARNPGKPGPRRGRKPHRIESSFFEET